MVYPCPLLCDMLCLGDMLLFSMIYHLDSINISNTSMFQACKFMVFSIILKQLKYYEIRIILLYPLCGSHHTNMLLYPQLPTCWCVDDYWYVCRDGGFVNTKGINNFLSGASEKMRLLPSGGTVLTILIRITITMNVFMMAHG